MSSQTPKHETPSTPDGSIVDYELEEQKNDSNYRVLWSKIMDQGPWKNTSTYKKVEVLFLCWAKNSDDMATKEEVNHLRSVFESRFNYHVEIKELDNHSEKKLQVQINSIVAGFVGSHDGQNTLLIVYYAGHGRPGDYYGSLELFGSTSPNDTKKRLDRMVWNKTEDLLKEAEADVLEIFDCCYAGTLSLTRGEHRFFEFLAATDKLGTTPVPGDDSFTSALIFALEALVKESEGGRFTTDALSRKIKDDAPHFPKDQMPVLSNREPSNISPGCIMLHPLDRNGTTAQLTAKEGNSLGPARCHTLTLHFDLGEKPSEPSIKALGLQLNQIFDPKNLGVIGVRYGSLQTPLINRACQNFRAFLGRSRRSNRKQQQPPIDTNLSVPCPISQHSSSTQTCNTSTDEGIHTPYTPDSIGVPAQGLPSSNEDSEDQMSEHRKKRKHSS